MKGNTLVELRVKQWNLGPCVFVNIAMIFQDSLGDHQHFGLVTSDLISPFWIVWMLMKEEINLVEFLYQI